MEEEIGREDEIERKKLRDQENLRKENDEKKYREKNGRKERKHHTERNIKKAENDRKKMARDSPKWRGILRRHIQFWQGSTEAHRVISAPLVISELIEKIDRDLIE